MSKAWDINSLIDLRVVERARQIRRLASIMDIWGSFYAAWRLYLFEHVEDAFSQLKNVKFLIGIARRSGHLTEDQESDLLELVDEMEAGFRGKDKPEITLTLFQKVIRDAILG